MTFRMKSVFAGACVLSLAAAILVFAGGKASSSSEQASEILALLPKADAVAVVDVRRLMTEAMPLALSTDASKVGKLNTHLDEFKAQTGLDPRKWDQVAIAARGTSIQTAHSSNVVAIARGSIDTAAIAAAGTIAPDGKYDDGVVIYLIKTEPKNPKSEPLAVAVLDQNTVVLGPLALVKETVESRNLGQRNADLVALALKEPNACVGFGANVPPHLSDGMNLPSPDLAKTLDSIRQVYGSMNFNASQVDLFAAARTHSTDEAQILSATLASLKDLASMVSTQLGADRAKIAQSAIENLKIDKAGDEVQLKLSIPETDIASLFQPPIKK